MGAAAMNIWNEADPYVMEMEIAAAADHGVNVFIYDWYWYDGRPVDAVVVGLAEIPVYDPAAGPLESLPVRGALPDDILLILGQALVPEVVGIMVGPHQVEFHAVTVPGLQKAIVQAILQTTT